MNAKKRVWAGRILSVVVMFPFVMSAMMKFRPNPQVLEGMAHMGLPEGLLATLAFLETMCIVVYLIPQTAVLGAILFTGYLGGAILTHLRVGEAVPLQVTLGVVIWGALYLREPRLWPLLPIRKCPANQ